MENVLFLMYFCIVGIFLISVYAVVEKVVDYMRKRNYVNEVLKAELADERRDLEFQIRNNTKLAKAEYRRANPGKRFTPAEYVNEKRYVQVRVNALIGNQKREFERKKRKVIKMANEGYFEYLREYRMND